jgi:tyrosinase
MAFVRRDVWSFDDPWGPALDWYEKAVGALQALPLDNPRSWRSLAAMHGIDRGGWEAFGYLTPGEVLPDLTDTLWNQCQHQSWYFLPWHRGYLHRFELIIRAKVKELGGPEDWTLPYWNYNGSRSRSNELPIAFRAATRPGGGTNHLFVKARLGPDAAGSANMVLDTELLGLDALLETDFEDEDAGGFGGPPTVFNWSEGTNGRLEMSPHNMVHSLVGGQAVSRPTRWDQVGLMSTPQTAALDPIFWLHHANIDRLWEVWLRRDPQNGNSTSPEWLNGPPATGRKFLMPGVDGQIAEVNVIDIANAQTLNYEYDDVADPLSAVPRRHRPASGGGLQSGGIFGSHMTSTAKEFASNMETVRMNADDGSVRVRIDARSKPDGALQGGGPLAPPPPRVYLRLDGVHAASPDSIPDATVFKVYVAAPSQPDAGLYVGSVSMFGAAMSQAPGSAHRGHGLAQTLDITDSYQALLQAGALANDELTVNFKKATDLSSLKDIQVDKVRLLHKP